MHPEEPSKFAFDLLLQHRAFVALLVLSGAVGVFALVQNSGAIVGGRISLPKVAWLNAALYLFVVLPAIVGWFANVDEASARLYRTVWWSFAARAVVEMYMLYISCSWKCGYGIAHDLFTAALVVLLWQDTGGLTLLLLITLLIETRMAYIFRRRMDPASGIYFADDSAHFASVNRFTRWVNALLYPAILWLLWRNHAMFIFP